MHVLSQPPESLNALSIVNALKGFSCFIRTRMRNGKNHRDCYDIQINFIYKELTAIHTTKIKATSLCRCYYLCITPKCCLEQTPAPINTLSFPYKVSENIARW